MNTSHSTVVFVGFLHPQVGHRLAAAGFQLVWGGGGGVANSKVDRSAAGPSQAGNTVLFMGHKWELPDRALPCP